MMSSNDSVSKFVHIFSLQCTHSHLERSTTLIKDLESCIQNLIMKSENCCNFLNKVFLNLVYGRLKVSRFFKERKVLYIHVSYY